MTSSPLGLYLPDQHGNWAVRYPTQVWSGLFEVLLFVGLLRFSAWQETYRADRHVPAWLLRDGTLTFLYLFLFCLERFLLEFLRQDYMPIWGPFSLPHLLMLAGMTLVLALLYRQTRIRPLPVQ
jgi:prolipoprotein diacylglyceryltransferase